MTDTRRYAGKENRMTSIYKIDVLSDDDDELDYVKKKQKDDGVVKRNGKEESGGEETEPITQEDVFPTTPADAIAVERETSLDQSSSDDDSIFGPRPASTATRKDVSSVRRGKARSVAPPVGRREPSALTSRERDSVAVVGTPSEARRSDAKRIRAKSTGREIIPQSSKKSRRGSTAGGEDNELRQRGLTGALECPFCDCFTGRISTMDGHIAAKHMDVRKADPPFSCTQCKRKYPCLTSLKSHWGRDGHCPLGRLAIREVEVAKYADEEEEKMEEIQVIDDQAVASAVDLLERDDDVAFRTPAVPRAKTPRPFNKARSAAPAQWRDGSAGPSRDQRVPFSAVRELVPRSEGRKRGHQTTVDSMEWRGIKSPAILQCPFCELLAETLTQMKEHIRTHSRVKNPPYSCTACTTTFTALFSMQRHWKTSEKCRSSGRLAILGVEVPKEAADEMEADSHDDVIFNEEPQRAMSRVLTQRDSPSTTPNQSTTGRRRNIAALLSSAPATMEIRKGVARAGTAAPRQRENSAGPSRAPQRARSTGRDLVPLSFPRNRIRRDHNRELADLGLAMTAEDIVRMSNAELRKQMNGGVISGQQLDSALKIRENLVKTGRASAFRRRENEMENDDSDEENELQILHRARPKKTLAQKVAAFYQSPNQSSSNTAQASSAPATTASRRPLRALTAPRELNRTRGDSAGPSRASIRQFSIARDLVPTTSTPATVPRRRRDFNRELADLGVELTAAEIVEISKASVRKLLEEQKIDGDRQEAALSIRGDLIKRNRSARTSVFIKTQEKQLSEDEENEVEIEGEDDEEEEGAFPDDGCSELAAVLREECARNGWSYKEHYGGRFSRKPIMMEKWRAIEARQDEINEVNNDDDRPNITILDWSWRGLNTKNDSLFEFVFTNKIHPSRRVLKVLKNGSGKMPNKCGKACKCSTESGEKTCKCRKEDSDYWAERSQVECWTQCPCPMTCPNRVVQRGRKIPLLMMRHHIKGWTMRAATDIKKGDFIGNYAGEVLTYAEHLKRKNETYSINYSLSAYNDNKPMEEIERVDDPGREKRRQTYMTGYCHRVFVITAKKMGNEGRTFSHSCKPNMKVMMTYLDRSSYGYHEWAFYAAEDIPKYTELTWNYCGDELEEYQAKGEKMATMALPAGCCCGHPECAVKPWTKEKVAPEFSEDSCSDEEEESSSENVPPKSARRKSRQ